MSRWSDAWAALRGKQPKQGIPAGKLGPPMRRMYHAAKRSRLTVGLGTSNSSADTELSMSLTNLRSASRQLIRDAAYAKRAKVIVVNNVIGSGVGMQTQIKNARGGLRRDVNSAIESAWRDWSCGEYCHTGGSLHFGDLERCAMGQVFEAGEVIIRKHYRAFSDSRIPFSLEVIESERLMDEYTNQSLIGTARGMMPGNGVRMGIELDSFHRPIAYWIRTLHPGDLAFRVEGPDQWERVPADQIYHIRLIDRWPQTRGEPWLHNAIRKLNDMDGYSEAEIVAARAASSYMGIIETDPDTEVAQTMDDGSSEVALEPGTMQRLSPGEKFSSFAPNRPNSAMDPFMRMMLREVAAGIGVSYESLSRDYSQSNYSSSRLALLDDRDLWRTLQQWWIRSFRLPLHAEWLQQAVLSGSIPQISVAQYANDRSKFEAVAFKPRGWSWIDPTKEVESAKEAIKAGLTTVTDVISQTANGMDIEDILEQRENELAMMKERGLVFDTSPESYEKEEKAAPAEAEEPEESEETVEPARARVIEMRHS